MASRIIRDENADPRGSKLTTDAALAAARARLAQAATNAPNARVLGPYGPRFDMSGDPASSSGVKVDMTELAPDVIAAIGSGGGGGGSAPAVTYTPSVPADWPPPPPTNVQEALDDLAAETGGTGLPGFVVRPYTLGMVPYDAAYQKSDGSVGPASAAGEATMPCIGFVRALDTPSLGLCQIQQSGDLAGFTGLAPGIMYVVSITPGKILREDTGPVDPNYPDESRPGTVIQQVGIASGTATLNIQLKGDITN